MKRGKNNKNIEYTTPNIRARKTHPHQSRAKPVRRATAKPPNGFFCFCKSAGFLGNFFLNFFCAGCYFFRAGVRFFCWNFFRAGCDFFAEIFFTVFFSMNFFHAGCDYFLPKFLSRKISSVATNKIW